MHHNVSDESKTSATHKRQRGAPEGKPRLLHRQTVLEMTGISPAHMYRLIRAGDFPAPVPIGARSVRWDASAVEDWIEERIAVSRAA